MTAASEDWRALAGDATGRLYGVVRCGGASVLLVAELSPEALQGGGSQDAASPLALPNITQVVAPAPPIDFTVTAAAASPNGHQLLLSGVAQQVDEGVDVPVLALVDLYGAQPAAAAADGSASTSSSACARAADSLAARHPGSQQRVAPLTAVHQQLYSERPGMRILQAAWHPGSPGHFGVLSSDNRWRLYNAGSQLVEAEQSFWLQLPGAGQPTLGLQRRRSGARTPPRLTAFAFGPPAAATGALAGGGGGGGWAAFAVFFLASDGGVYVLCPVAPFGMRARAAAVRALPGIEDRGSVHAWLLAAFLEVLSHESAAAVSAQPHVLETLAPALQGPLNPGAASLKPCTAQSVACTMALSSSGAGAGYDGATAGGQCGSRFSALLTGFSSGSVFAHALELAQVAPAWQDATPLVAFDHRGEVAAVRYTVEAVPVAAATAAPGLPSVPEGDADGAGMAGGAGQLTSPLLLLDALRINLHAQRRQQQRHSQGGGGGSMLSGGAAAAGAADSDEESDAGYDPAQGVSRSGGRRAELAGAGGAPGRAPGSSASDDDDDWVDLGAADAGADGEDTDDEDAEEEVLQQLSKVSLLAAPDLPGRFWVCHDQGAWGLNIKWLGQLNAAAAAAAGDDDGQLLSPLGGSSGAGSGSGCGQGAQLAAPVLQELLVTRSGIDSACVVGNALLGTGAVVLQRGGTAGAGVGAGAQQGAGAPPQLMLLKPRPTGVLGEGVLGSAAAAAEAAGDVDQAQQQQQQEQPQQQPSPRAAGAGGIGPQQALGGGDAASLAALHDLHPDEVAIRCRMEDYYADLTAGPRRLPPPPKPANAGRLSPADPAGVQYLQAATSWLLQTHVSFAAGAAADMCKRVHDLHELVHTQQQSVGELQSLAAAAAARQAALQARLDRLGQAAAALSERGALLATLHWSMPRQLSRAEARLGRQLEVWDMQLQDTQAAWSALSKRIHALTDDATKQQQQQQQQQQAGSSRGAAPPGAAAAASPAAAGAAFRGVPALAAARARERAQLVAPAPGPLAAAQLEKVKEQLMSQHAVISHDAAELDELMSHLEAWRLEHPAADLPARLSRLGTVL